MSQAKVKNDVFSKLSKKYHSDIYNIYRNMYTNIYRNI